jgi:hypothetical protein
MVRLKITLGTFVLVDQSTETSRCDFDTTEETTQFSQQVAKESCVDGCDIKLFGRGSREQTVPLKVVRFHASPQAAFVHKVQWGWTVPKDVAMTTFELSGGAEAWSKAFNRGIIQSVSIVQQGSVTEDSVTLLLSEPVEGV